MTDNCTEIPVEKVEGELVDASELVSEEVESVPTIPEESITLFEKVKSAMDDYQLELLRFFEIGNEAEVTTAGRSNPLTKEEMQEVCTKTGLPFIMISFSDANFTWREFYTVDATAIAALD